MKQGLLSARRLGSLACLLVLHLCAATTSRADILAGPITNAANGHIYYLLSPTNWPSAEAEAVRLGGHLATINDAVENTWVFNRFATNGGVPRSLWLGLNDAAHEGIWVWVGGESAAYRNWAPGEPNNGGGYFPDEDQAVMRGPALSYPDSWNDAPSDQSHAAVVELIAPTPPSNARIYDVAADFSTHSNPNGVWSYGYSTTLGGPVTLHNEQGNASGLDYWRTDLWLGVPGVYFNPANSPVTNNTAVLGPHQLSFHPGPNGELCLIRFTAPSNGQYQVSGVFTGVDTDGTTTDVHILVNGVIFDGLVNGYGPGSGPTFNLTAALHAEDRIDFAVGRGDNHEFSFDSTGLALQISLGSNAPPAGIAPTITSHPQSRTVNAGTDVTFTTAATGTAPLSYQWRRNGTNLAGATGVLLTLSNVQPAQAGNYSVRVTNAFGVATSSNAVLTVVLQASNSLINVNFGGHLTPEGLSSNKVGIAAIGQTTNDLWNFYSRDIAPGQWRQNGELANLQQADGSATAVGLLVANLPGAYYNSSTDPMYHGFLYPFSGNATLTVTNLPTGQYEVYLYSGQANYRLQVGASDYGIRAAYEATIVNPPVWQEGVQYARFTNVQVSAGQAVTITVSPGAFGIAAIAGLQIMRETSTPPAGIAPTITSHPQSRTVNAGANVTFFVSATGTAPLSYQWRRNGTNLVGAMGASLTLSNVQPAQAGNYSVRVTNAFGVATSSNAVLTVLLSPTNCLSAPTGLVSWWRADSNTVDSVGSNHGDLAGNASFGAGRVGQSFVFDGNGDGVRIGNPTNLQLQNFTIEAWIKRSSPSVVSFSLSGLWAEFVCYGTGGYAFGLLNDGRLFLSKVDIDQTQTPVGIGITDTNFHHVAVTKSGSVVVFYIDGAAYPVTPYNTTYTFTSPTAIGVRGDNLSSSFYGAIDELAIYNRALSASEVQGIYNAGGFGKCGPPAGIAPTIISQPQSRTVNAGTNVTFFVTATGTAPLSYQWRRNETNLAGATGTSLTLSNVQPANAGSYSVRVTNAFGAVISSNAVLTVNSQSVSNALINVNFGGHLTPEGLSSNKVGIAAIGQTTNDLWNFYSRDIAPGQWRQNGELANLQQADGSATAVGLLVSNLPGAYYNSSTDLMYHGFLYPFSGNATLTVTNLPTGQYEVYLYSGQANYRLQVGASDYGIRTAYEATIVNPPVWQEGVQYARFTNVQVSAGQAVTITVSPGAFGIAAIAGLQIMHGTSSPPAGIPPTITSHPQSRTVNAGTDVTFFVTATGTAPLSYQWRRNETNLAGATGTSLTLSNVQPANAGSYSVRVTNAFGAATSSNAVLTVALASYDVSADYSLAANPNAVWRYGALSNLGGPLTLLTSARTFAAENGVPIGEWNPGGVLHPHVNKVLGPGTGLSAGGAFVAPAGTVYFTPGEDETAHNFGVIRFTVPAGGAGNYRIVTAVQPLFDGDLSADADFHVDKNGVELFGSALAPNQATSYSSTVALAAGDTIDFAIGRGADGVLGTTGLKIQATLSQLTGTLAAGAGTFGVTSLVREPGTSARLCFGGVAGNTYTIQASTNLMNWEVVGTSVADSNGACGFEDLDSTRFPCRYYRVVVRNQER